MGFKTYLVLPVYFLSTLLAGAQQGNSHRYSFGLKTDMAGIEKDRQSIKIHHRMDGMTLTGIHIDEGDFYRIGAEGYSRTAEPGKPELPVISRLITIQGDASPEIRISNVRSEFISPASENFRGLLYPAQESETKNLNTVQRKFALDQRIYSSRGFIPSDTVRIEEAGIIRGKKIANLIISPVRYDPSSNRLEIITSMDIDITFKGEDGLLSGVTSEESLLFSETLSKGVLNYSPGDLITGYSDEPVRMIIVTDTIFRKQLEPFLKWKTIKGFRTDVLYKGRDFAATNYLPLKDTLQKLYDHYSMNSVAPEYLLIIGDVSKIPYYGTGYVSDTYYGEFDGDGDYIPDMFIGRLPVRDTGQLSGVLRKLIEYEMFEFEETNDFYNRALATAGKDENYADHMNGQVKYAVTNYLNESNGITGHHFYYPESFTRKDSIISLINNGLSFINYSGHGVSSGWLHVEIKTPDIAGLTNRSMYPFIVSNACRTAQYDDSLSFGNKMVVSEGKGAIGFIGCSNDSYWDEDFYWAVGSGTPSSSPEFLTTGAGAYDRLFHTHGESPSEWYYTMGMVNFAGNLSVTASTSSRKKYYWETYTLLGDPSLTPIIGQPSVFTVSLPDTIPNGIRTLSLITDPFAYVAISHRDTLWDASFASPSGAVSLDLPVISDDSCLVVITGQNKIPLFKKIYISPVEKEYINYTLQGINDPQGNDNRKADFGETFYLDLKIGNYGGSDASGISAVISSDSEWISILTDSVYIGTLAAGSEIILDNDFEI
ncbi:MAG: C25 family cysteine peptidase, partial [Bacteroidales bacterium]|nr:C25 family cysteine peptidase [Bacteroidales bacterium]